MENEMKKYWLAVAFVALSFSPDFPSFYYKWAISGDLLDMQAQAVSEYRQLASESRQKAREYRRRAEEERSPGHYLQARDMENIASAYEEDARLAERQKDRVAENLRRNRRMEEHARRNREHNRRCDEIIEEINNLPGVEISASQQCMSGCVFSPNLYQCQRNCQVGAREGVQRARRKLEYKLRANGC